jgi:chromosome segregation ATPase
MSDIPGPGHNLPPGIDLGKAGDALAVLKPRADHLLEQAGKIPEYIDEALAGDVTDFVKSIASHIKSLEGARVAEKEPFLTAARQVDGMFNALKEQLQQAKGRIEARLAVTLRRKEAREREAARVKAEEERRAAEARKAEADRIAREERERADRARRDAEAAEERARVEREAAQREVDAAEARRRKAEADAASAKRNSRRTVERARAAEQRARDDQRQTEARTAEDTISAGIDARIARRQAREADTAASDQAQRVDAADAKVQKVRTAKPATFAKTRGDYGGVGTLQRYWTFANIDREALDLEPLRHLIPLDGIERAIRAYIDAGGRRLAGVDIYEDDKPRVT